MGKRGFQFFFLCGDIFLGTKRTAQYFLEMIYFISALDLYSCEHLQMGYIKTFTLRGEANIISGRTKGKINYVAHLLFLFCHRNQ